MGFVLLSVKGYKDKIMLDSIKAMILTEFQKEGLISFDAQKNEVTLLTDSPIIRSALFK